MTHIPLTELWNDQGRLDAPRGGRIGSAESQQLLHGELAFAIATRPATSMGPWKRRLQLLEVRPPHYDFRLGDFAGSYCYSATHWAQANGSGIVLLEKHY